MFAIIIVSLLKGSDNVTGYEGYPPNFDEAAMARKAYLDWERSCTEELTDYVDRRRKVDLSVLVGEAVKNELTNAERSVVEKIYYEQKTLTQTARELGVNKSTAERTLKRATDKLRRCLSYVVKYQYDRLEVPFLTAAVREALALDALRTYNPKSFGERLRRFRLTENLSPHLLSNAIGISVKRFLSLESGTAPPDVEELLALSGFFKTTVDYLLTGK